jgi:micrococcal nuclease
LGLDTPEIHGKCKEEKELAQKAKKYVVDQISNDPMILKNIHYGKYAGRILADVELKNGHDLAQLLIRKGLGRQYLGGKRKSWCP